MCAELLVCRSTNVITTPAPGLAATDHVAAPRKMCLSVTDRVVEGSSKFSGRWFHQFNGSANKIEGSRPEWCISSMVYSGNTPFWLETLEIKLK